MAAAARVQLFASRMNAFFFFFNDLIQSHASFAF